MSNKIYKPKNFIIKILKSRKVIAVTVILLMVIPALSPFVLRGQDGTGSSKSGPIGTDEISDSGTYVTTMTIPVSVAGLEGLESCVEVVEADVGLLCKLSDEEPSISLKSPPTCVVDNKTYKFSGWQGCPGEGSEQDIFALTLSQGANRALTAAYSVIHHTKEDAQTRSVEPIVKLSLGVYSSDKLFSFWFNTLGGSDTAKKTMGLFAQVLMRSCRITDSYTRNDKYFTSGLVELLALSGQKVQLVDGEHTIRTECLVNDTSETITTKLPGRVADNQPKDARTMVSATSLEESRTGIVGTREGCLDTP